MDETLPIGKLPADLLARLLARAPAGDPRVLQGPGVGLDCAVVEFGDALLVFKSDPITFATDRIGEYLVQINANDIATTGAVPRWLLVTLLLPQRGTTDALAEALFDQIYEACRAMNVAVIGGHTEITHGLDRPLAVGALIGEVERHRLVSPTGAQQGDRILLTKGVPIEATAVLAREFPARLAGVLSEEELAAAKAFLTDPGIGVLRDAQVALSAGTVTAMHDPTEGGLATALWELAEASDRVLTADPDKVPVPALSAKVCAAFGIDPLSAIASGSLLLSVPAGEAAGIAEALDHAGIPCADIGEVGGPGAELRRLSAGSGEGGSEPWPMPVRDAIAGAYAP